MRVAKDAHDLDAAGEETIECGGAVVRVGGACFGQHRAGNIEECKQLVVPVEGVDIEKECARCVGVVGGMCRTARKFPYEP